MADLVQALTLCGLNPVQRNLVMSQGIETLVDLKTLTEDEIKNMCRDIRKTVIPPPPPIDVGPAGRGGRGGRGGAGGRGAGAANAQPTT